MANLPIYIEVNAKRLRGWMDASYTRSIEHLSAEASLSLDWQTEQTKPVKSQDECKVFVGDKQIMSGYVMSAKPAYSREEGIKLMVRVRAKTGDLTVGSAVHAGGQWKNAKADKIVRDICKPFGIKVSVQDGVSVGAAIKLFDLNTGEAAIAAISRVLKYRGLLATSDYKGGLLITRAGVVEAKSSIRLGVGGNVIAMTSDGDDSQRCRHYIARSQGSVNLFGDSKSAATVSATATDKFIKRDLTLQISADEPAGGKSDLQALVDHTARVRAGRANGYKYTLDGWEEKGEPWLENTRVAVYDPLNNFNGDELLIVSVNGKVDRKNGDVCDLVLRPIFAYEQRAMPEPSSTEGSLWD